MIWYALRDELIYWLAWTTDDGLAAVLLITVLCVPAARWLD